jgi:hypothetical protein
MNPNPAIIPAILPGNETRRYPGDPSFENPFLLYDPGSSRIVPPAAMGF